MRTFLILTNPMASNTHCYPMAAIKKSKKHRKFMSKGRFYITTKTQSYNISTKMKITAKSITAVISTTLLSYKLKA